jgi:hypothetical protein
LKGKKPVGRPTNRWDGDTREDVAGFCENGEINAGIISYSHFTCNVTLGRGRATILAVET